MKSFFPFLILIIVFAGCKTDENNEEIIKPVKYERISNPSGDLNVNFSGIVKSESEINLSFKVGGSLTQVNVKLGDKVSKGDLIASVDATEYIIQRDKAISQKKSAESQLVSARSSFERIEKLYENNSVSLSEYEKAKVNLSSAQSSYDAAVTQVRLANNQLSCTKLYAPMDGIISSVNVETNEVINTGKTIAVLSSEGNPQVEVEVSESLISKLEKGQKAKIIFPSLSDQEFDGELVEIAFASGQSSTYPVKLNIFNAVKEIRPGMASEVNFIMEIAEEDTKSDLIAPLKAIASGVEGNYVFKLVPAGEEGIYTAEKLSVELGDITENGYIINSGLNQGDLVAVAGLRVLYDGRKVKLLND
jgi:multidrug efflux system membrane fusion protein